MIKMSSRKKPLISVVIPAFNEEKNVSLLYKELKEVLKSLGKYEIIFVDDGSTDSTFKELKKLYKKGNLKVIKFRRNFGKAAAMSAGLKVAKGKYIITMDADLQDNPQEIPKFLKNIEKEDYDMIVGWKYPREDTLSKKIASKIFNFLVRRVTEVKLHDCGSNFRIFHKELKEHLPIYGGFFRYIPVIAHWKGFRVGEMKVKHRKRKYGKTKWGKKRLFKGFFDLLTIKYLTSFSESPLHLFGGIGSFIFGLGTLIGIYLLYVKYLLDQSIGCSSFLFSALMIIIGIQFISFGLLTEMIKFNNTREKNYLIEEKLV